MLDTLINNGFEIMGDYKKKNSDDIELIKSARLFCTLANGHKILGSFIIDGSYSVNFVKGGFKGIPTPCTMVEMEEIIKRTEHIEWDLIDRDNEELLNRVATEGTEELLNKMEDSSRV